MKGVKNSLHTTPSVNELQNLYSRDASYIATKAHQQLGYTPQFDLETGLRLSVLWLEHQGFFQQAPVRLAEANRNHQKNHANQQEQDFRQPAPTPSAGV